LRASAVGAVSVAAGVPATHHGFAPLRARAFFIAMNVIVAGSH